MTEYTDDRHVDPFVLHYDTMPKVTRRKLFLNTTSDSGLKLISCHTARVYRGTYPTIHTSS